MASILAEFTEADIDRLVAWISTPELLGLWAGHNFVFPFNRGQMEAHLAGDRETRHIFKALDPRTAQPVGHIELGNVNRVHSSARIGRVFVAAEYRGRGYATQMMRDVLELAFDQLQLNRVELTVFDFNASAIACYERVGFRREGLRREVFRRPDGYWNQLLMSMLAREWRAGRT